MRSTGYPAPRYLQSVRIRSFLQPFDLHVKPSDLLEELGLTDEFLVALALTPVAG
jgi:hypothetical protein